jgi:hypothetical protein
MKYTFTKSSTLHTCTPMNVSKSTHDFDEVSTDAFLLRVLTCSTNDIGKG